MSRLPALLLGLLLAMSAVACEEIEEAAVTGFLIEWWLDHPINAVESQLGTQDAETTAALDGEGVMERINRADELADEGRRNRDPAKLDEALELRPNDWSYLASRGVLALETGHLADYETFIERSRASSYGSFAAVQAHDEQHFSELDALEQRLTDPRGPGFSSAEQCVKLYDDLIHAMVAAQAFAFEDEQARFRRYKDLQQRCV